MKSYFKADYHIHYYLDACASSEMTFQNIEAAAIDLELDEIAVLKHYSKALPNGEKDWGSWHTIVPEQFETFLKEFKGYEPKKIRIFSGVETELIHENGDINIPLAEQNKVDMIALSAHYMIDLELLKMDLLEHPSISKLPESKQAHIKWLEKVAEIGVINVLEGFVNGYINAIKRFPKIKTMAHMYDGLRPIRSFKIPIDTLKEGQIVEVLEPLMTLAAERNILWELSESDNGSEAVLKRANELGVSFTPTADGHYFKNNSWGNLYDYNRADDYITKKMLRRGRLHIS